MKKSTEELTNELREAGGLEGFIVKNHEQFRRYTLSEYLQHLLEEKHLSKAEIIAKAGLDQIYAYHIFAGRKKNPSRNKVIALALSMELTPEETQYLLYYAGAEGLYVRSSRDSVLWYALNNRLGVAAAQNLLQKTDEDLLF